MLPVIPSNAPKRDIPILSALAKKMLKLLGWQLVGELPDRKKVMIALAPHTSNWDFITAALCLLAIQLRISFIMKKEAFIWPVGSLFKKLGGIPLDRSKGQGTVAKVAAWYASVDKGWLAIAPEGTRSKTETWKTGFLEIAKQAEIPVLLICWDYPRKTIFIDQEWPVTGDHQADVAAMREYVNKNYSGKHTCKQ